MSIKIINFEIFEKLKKRKLFNFITYVQLILIYTGNIFYLDQFYKTY